MPGWIKRFDKTFKRYRIIASDIARRRRANNVPARDRVRLSRAPDTVPEVRFRAKNRGRRDPADIISNKSCRRSWRGLRVSSVRLARIQIRRGRMQRGRGGEGRRPGRGSNLKTSKSPPPFVPSHTTRHPGLAVNWFTNKYIVIRYDLNATENVDEYDTK